MGSLHCDLDCTDPKAWCNYIHSHPLASSYHRYGWRDVVEKSFKHRCYYITVKNNEQAIVGVLPLVFMQSRLFGRFLVSLPFFNYGGLLADNIESCQALLGAANSLKSQLNAEYVELRHREEFALGLSGKAHKVAMILGLEKTADDQWQAFNAKLRNQIRKSEKSNFHVRIGSQELLDDFYAVFARNMRDLGTPVYAKSFFGEVMKTFADSCAIIAVYSGEKAVASGFLSWFRETVEIPWASSLREFNSLCPNNLLYWTALKFSIEKGCRFFDFGRSSPGEGTYRFKAQWGAKPLQLYWQYLLTANEAMPELNVKNPKYQRAINIWKRMPVFLTRLIGPNIVRNIP